MSKLATALKNGANPNATDEFNPTKTRTPLTLLVTTANNSKSTAMIEELIRYGADVDLRDYNGDTPLALAVNSGRFGVNELDRSRMIAILVKAGGDVYEKDKTGRSPVDYLKSRGDYKNLEVISSILSRSKPAKLLTVVNSFRQ